MTDIYVGIDNGVSGSIGWVGEKTGQEPTPVFKSFDYQKSKAKQINRVSTEYLYELLEELQTSHDKDFENYFSLKVFIERPMVNPKRFAATVSALRALEATLITVEELGLPFEYCDSKKWQKQMLPPVKGAPELKKASAQMGRQLFPKVTFDKDADGILIAEWARRNQL